ncbi:hypothetical protein P153DRAFT_299402, partial [Dothidotthia symphoricarpi CBS 119687]
IFKSNKVKGSFFLITLLDTINYIINNLLTRNITLFTKIKLKILNLAKKYSINITNSLAYSINTTLRN